MEDGPWLFDTVVASKEKKRNIYMYMVGCVWKNVRRDRDGSVYNC